MYERIKALARCILDSGRNSFSLKELFEVVTGRDLARMGKRSDRHIGRFLAGQDNRVQLVSCFRGDEKRWGKGEPLTP